MDKLFLDSEMKSGEVLLQKGDKSRLLFANFDAARDAKIKISVPEEASVEIAFADFSRGQSKLEIDVELNGEGASCAFHGAVLAKEKDRKTVLANCFHNAPHTSGLVETYGITEDQSYLEFAGRSEIKKGSVSSTARQAAKIIVFDAHCIAHASPILCIDENDVSASHAAIVGKLNEEHLFYLLSRGISLKDARRLITLGYLKPIEAYFEGETKERISQAIEGGI